MNGRTISAQDEPSVGRLYENASVAENYIGQRFGHPWGKLLHRKQVDEIDNILHDRSPGEILEIAPGPARLAAELKNVGRGLMIEHSSAMLAVAKQRLRAAKVDHLWEIRQGNAFELQKLKRRFSFVFTFRFIRHFRLNDRARLYFEISKCLHRNGLLLFDVVNKRVRERVDARYPQKAADQLDVYDEAYTPESFHREMREHGFRVLRMTSVVNHFFLQSWVSHRLGYRFPKVSSALVDSLETIPSNEPLEWIALCQKRAKNDA